MAACPESELTEIDCPAIHALGVDGLLINFGTRLSEPANRAALAFRAAVDEADFPGLIETSTSLTSVYLRLDLMRASCGVLRQSLENMLRQRDWYDASMPTGRKLWHVSTVFGTDIAPQLEEAANLAGLSPEDAIASICATPLRVQTIGFAPGQPYLGELPLNWDIPRQTALTPRVPVGALVVAIRQMVLFSVTAPTGWRHVGQTAMRLFRPDAPDPFLLRPGDEVLFRPVTRKEYEHMRDHDPMGGAVSERLV
ncbi:MAG: 5-oxoprolinase subunit B family protein [Roseinatronobacter sp.]